MMDELVKHIKIYSKSTNNFYLLLKKLRHENKTKFSYSNMVELLSNLFNNYIPELKLEPKFNSLKMPKLKTVSPTIKLPKLKKV